MVLALLHCYTGGSTVTLVEFECLPGGISTVTLVEFEY